ncbi:Eight transmembrane protein EpsH [Nitrincola lacisaponensis]|uniref:Eight transmembrane protein EpsH n=1 Tax=Nitrincola lacisaponensis TaxID=267850 RepID=A0A063Y3W9_9GAMM|nr:VPLPA-CTERM-specific exosortase XrtD [Nitrincola lacisaponensis]KDE39232.1 Eight transmembrane protein EpsH [Nitrincola lacisaponensis]
MNFFNEITSLQKYVRWHTILMLLFALVGAVFLSFGALQELVERWSVQEEYSHGFLIPLVSLYILWEKRFDIINDYKSGSFAGVVLVFLSLFFISIGELSELYIISRYSFILLLLGISVTLLGRASKHTLVPIALLVFSIPLPYFLEAVLTARMQLISSEIGVYLIKLMGIPVYLSGNVIDLGEFKLQVVEACSGLRYLYPLACLGFIAAYFYQAPLWKRAVLLLSTVPITIFMNSFRIAVTGLLVEKWGTGMAEGFLHDFEGWIIFIACAVILALEIEILERVTRRQGILDVFGINAASEVDSDRASVSDTKSVKAHHPLMIATFLIYFAAMSGLFFEKKLQEFPVSASLSNFPSQVNGWSGWHGGLDTHVLQVLQLTDYLMMNFEREEQPLVNFYVAFYESQRGGIAPHSPRVCIPGGGWEIADIRRTHVDDIPINRVIIRRGLESQLVYYWFQERGEPVANEYLKKWTLLQDAIKYNRTDGALVRVVTPFNTSEPVEEADRRLKEFVRSAYPELLKVLPGKGEL